MIGRTVGKYRIVGQLGRGGAGVVYKAVDETLGRDVAVKMLNPDLADTEVMTRFRAEATILARLNHPQIATIFELFRADADYLMVMEFVRGETLDKLSERLGPIEPDRAAYVIDLILSALEHAHRGGVVHRDVKPANVMVTDEGGIKIMDFGIARVLGAEQKTVDGRLMGTPAYMSPEQVLGEEVDGRADLYSVGVLLYRLLSGTLPFKADSALAMLQRQIRDEPISLHLQRPELPDWCDQIVQRALMKSPADRFQSAEEFREALARATGPLAVADLAKTFAATTASAPGPTDTIDLSRTEAFAEPAAAPVPVRRKRQGGFAMAYSLVTVLTIAIAFASYVILRGTATEAAIEPPAPPPSPTLPAADAPPAKVVNDLPEPTPVVENVEPVPAPIKPRVERPEPADRIVSLPAPRRAEAEAPKPEPALVVDHTTTPPVVVDAALVFDTRVLVGTKKPKEYSARLMFGEGKVSVVANDERASLLYAIPYGRVVSVSYSHGRDPLWNSPQGPTPVARGGGTLSRFGITVERNWISLRTSTEEQFVAVRVDKVLEQRVLLALEERTGRKPELVEEPKD
jgi:serine/threonine-protein kinase